MLIFYRLFLSQWNMNVASVDLYIVIKGFYLVIIQYDGVKCIHLRTINIFARIAPTFLGAAPGSSQRITAYLRAITQANGHTHARMHTKVLRAT